MLKRDVFSTEEFKQQSKYFVFVHIDGDQQPDLTKHFGVSGYPTIKFMKPDETIVHEAVGYRPLAAFLAEMDKARAKGGL